MISLWIRNREFHVMEQTISMLWNEMESLVMDMLMPVNGDENNESASIYR